MSGDDPACTWLRGSSNPPARTSYAQFTALQNAPGTGMSGVVFPSLPPFTDKTAGRETSRPVVIHV